MEKRFYSDFAVDSPSTLLHHQASGQPQTQNAAGGVNTHDPATTHLNTSPRST
jgi:hypothetical protein